MLILMFDFVDFVDFVLPVSLISRLTWLFDSSFGLVPDIARGDSSACWVSEENTWLRMQLGIPASAS